MPKTISLSTPIPYTARQLDSNYVDSQISSIQSQIKSVKSSLSYYAAKIKKTTNKKTLQTLKTKYNNLNSKYNSLNSLLTYYNKFKTSEWYIPTTYRAYLKETAYAQQSNPNIVILAQELTTNDSYDTANNIFVWVRDNIDYQFYYKTKYGATGTLQGGDGNCVDQAHLVVALARSAGIPARYVRGYCQFISGNYYAHVWAQVWVKDYGWLTADTTHSINTLGTARNWNASKSTIYGTLVEYSST
jgi:transglutaminase-like putative cysteine protease